MITSAINLIASQRRQKQRALMMMRVAFYSLFGIVALMGLLYLKLLVTTQQVRAQVDTIQAELSSPELADKVARIGFLETQTKELKPRVQLLEKVHSSEAEWIRILNDVSACLPTKVWLGQLTSQRSDKQQSIQLRGKALNQAEIGEFMLSLNRPAWSATAALNFAQATSSSQDGAQLFDFEISVPLQTVIGSNLK